ncbi:uncharacterized protein PG998_000207 [Apiospora kogelbergensis]|uniref:uncharacterized protein n=1 Tax=Apiospora kogelbergensis TaxID=1337665 RepID=UPI0031319751
MFLGAACLGEIGPSKENTDTASAVLVAAAGDDGTRHPPTTKSESETKSEYAYQRDYRFWCIIFALCITMQILCSLENTVVVTSLPTTVNQLGLGSNYIWVTNIFFLATSIVQPLIGQLARLFGRRHVALCVVALYTLGSGLAGGANGGVILIVGRLRVPMIILPCPGSVNSVRLSTPTRAGVQILPITLIAVPRAAVGAVALTKLGRYKLLHIIGFALLTAGIGSFSVLSKNSSTAEWILPSIGAGMVLDTLLPAFQAGIEECDSAAAAASWSFVRSFGNIWGVAIPGAILNIYSSQYVTDLIADPTVRSSLQNGDAYASATRDFVVTLPEPPQSQVIEVITKALAKVFLIGIAFPALAFLFFVYRAGSKAAHSARNGIQA